MTKPSDIASLQFVKHVCAKDQRLSWTREFATLTDGSFSCFNLSEEDAYAPHGQLAKIIYAPPNETYPEGSFRIITGWGCMGRFPQYDVLDLRDVQKASASYRDLSPKTK